MKNPANEIVNEFGLRKCLVATFMSNDPEARPDQTCSEAIEGPERK